VDQQGRGEGHRLQADKWTKSPKKKKKKTNPERKMDAGGTAQRGEVFLHLDPVESGTYPTFVLEEKKL